MTATLLPASRSPLPTRVTVVEVSPRDGLQSETAILPTATKVRLIERLADAGLPVVEATSFVSPRAVPQLADAEEVLRALRRKPGVRYPVLVPNEKGLERALAAGAEEIAIFGSASESYSRKNLGRTREESVEMFRPVARRAMDAGLRLRAYLSMVIADPWEGAIAPAQVVEMGRRMLDLGCDELSLGDTTGDGTTQTVRGLVRAFLDAGVPASQLAAHFHDKHGGALDNALAAMELGVAVIDASAGGIGGSTVIEGAAGNLATEDLIAALRERGVETGVDLEAVAATTAWMAAVLGRDLRAGARARRA